MADKLNESLSLISIVSMNRITTHAISKTEISWHTTIIIEVGEFEVLA